MLPKTFGGNEGYSPSPPPLLLRKIFGIFALNKVNNAPIDWNRSKGLEKLKRAKSSVFKPKISVFGGNGLGWNWGGPLPPYYGKYCWQLLADLGDTPLSSHFTEKISQTVFEHSLKTQMWLYDVWCHGQCVKFNGLTLDQVWFGFRPHWAQETEHLWGKQVKENKKKCCLNRW